MKNWHSFIEKYCIIGIFQILLLLRGGYFYYESMIFGMVATLFFLFSSRSGKLRFPYQRQELILPFLFYLFYALPFLWAEKMHIYGYLKLLAPFLLTCALLYREDPISLLQKALRAYAYLLFLAFFLWGVQEIFHYFEISYGEIPIVNRSFVIKSRFTGFVQYANTNGLLSLLAGLASVFAWKNILLALICGLSLGLSGSRTAWILSAVGLIVLLSYNFFLKSEKPKQDRIQLSALLSFVASLAGGIILVSIALTTNRITDGLQASELQTRFLYYEDGVKMLLQNPWGLGHYGYHILQRQFQTGSTYYIKYIHNFLLQIALDGGVWSLFIFLAMLVGAVLWPLFNELKKGKQLDRTKGFLLWLAILALAHSLLEFHFEFSYVVLLFWLFYFSVKKRKDTTIGDKLPCFATTIKKGMAILAGAAFMVGAILSVMTLYGWPQIPARLGFVDAQKIVLREADDSLRLEIAKRMEKQPLKNVETFAFLRDYYYNRGELAQAITYGKIAVELAPLWIMHREELMKIQYAYVLKHIDNSADVAEDVLSVPQTLETLKRKRQTARNVRHKPQWEMTEPMKVWYENIRKLYSEDIK